VDFEQFKDELWQTAISFKSAFEELIYPVFESEGLTQLQANVLFGIKNNFKHKVGHKVGELAEMLKENQGNFSSACKKMEQMGLIFRERSKEDERVVTLKVTALGEEKLRNIHEKLRGIYRSLDIPEEKCVIILAGLKAMREIINNVSKERNGNHNA